VILKRRIKIIKQDHKQINLFKINNHNNNSNSNSNSNSNNLPIKTKILLIFIISKQGR